MESFTALKTAIQNAIKQNGNEEITGDVLQQILLSIVNTMGDGAINTIEQNLSSETLARQGADNTLQQNINSEAGARQSADNTLQSNINAEALARGNADTQLQNAINSEESARDNADTALQGNINTERNARIAADDTLDGKIDTEKNQRIAAVNYLNAAITAINDSVKNGYVYAGIAQPSSAPMTGKVFYIATKAGQYVNFSNIQVPAGINILKKAGSTWVSDFVFNSDALMAEIVSFEEQVRTLLEDYQPIIINGDVVNAPDEVDITAQPDGLLKFKDKAYDPLVFSGMGRKYLRKNIRPEADSVDFDGFVEDVPTEDSLTGTPDSIWWDRIKEVFVGKKDDVYYLAWTDDDSFVPASTELIYMFDGNPYRWNGTEFYVDEDVVPTLKNILTQAMISQQNTIYVIQYDYDLNGASVTIPEDCVLQFDGGSLSNGTVVGNSSVLNAGICPIFDEINIGGSWLVKDIYSDWFEDIHDANKVQQLFSLCNDNIHNDVYISEGEYACRLIETTYPGISGTALTLTAKNVTVNLNGTLKLEANGLPDYYVLSVHGSENIIIRGNGAIVGDRDDHDYTTRQFRDSEGNWYPVSEVTRVEGHYYLTSTLEGGVVVPSSVEVANWSTHEWGRGICVKGESRNIYIEGISISSMTGDSLNLNYSTFIIIKNITLHDSRRQGITIGVCKNVHISNFHIYNINGVAPYSAIDIEPDYVQNTVIGDILIENGIVENCYQGILSLSMHGNKPFYNVKISNVKFSNMTLSGHIIGCVNNADINIENINLDNVSGSIGARILEIRGSNCVCKGVYLGENVTGISGIANHSSNLSVQGFNGTLTGNGFFFCHISPNDYDNENTYIYDSNVEVEKFFALGSYGASFTKNLRLYNCSIKATNQFSGNINSAIFENCNLSGLWGTTLKTNNLVIKDSTINLDKVILYGDNPKLVNNIINCQVATTQLTNMFLSKNVITTVSESDALVFGNTKGEVSGNIINTSKGCIALSAVCDIIFLNNTFNFVDNPDYTSARYIAAAYNESAKLNEFINNKVIGDFTRFSNGAGFRKIVLDLPTEGTKRPAIDSRYNFYGLVTFFDKSFSPYKPTWYSGYWVDINGERVSWNVTFILTNVTSDYYGQPTANAPYSIKLTAQSGYSLPATITVKIGATTLTAGTDYTYNQSTGDVTVLGVGGTGGVVDALTITAEGVANT